MKKKANYFFISAWVFLLLSVNFSCKKALTVFKHENILVFGNSITKCPPVPAYGWYGNWGMAASSEDKDYIHILTNRYKNFNPNSEITPVIFSDWEASHAKYDLSQLDKYFIVNPSRVIIRLGENVQDPTNFANSLTKLINYIKSKSPETKFIITGVFWENLSIESQLKEVASTNSIPFIKLDYLDTKENRSFIGAKVKDVNGNIYEIKDQGVASHPGDLGMQKIADLLYDQLVKD